MPKIRDEKRLWIRQAGGSTQGPYPTNRVRVWINQGKVRPEMEFSIDGEHWMPGDAIPGIFDPVVSLAGPNTARSKHMLMILCLLAGVGLFLSFLPFVEFKAEAFAALGDEFSIWSNAYGGLGASLFGVLVVLAAYHWRRWDGNAERVVGFTAIGVGILQLAAFVLVAAVVQAGWTGDSADSFDAHGARDDIPEFTRTMRDLTGGPKTPEDKKTWAAIQKLTEFTDTMTPRPSFSVGLYGLALCAISVLACGIGVVKRE